MRGSRASSVSFSRRSGGAAFARLLRFAGPAFFVAFLSFMAFAGFLGFGCFATVRSPVFLE